VSGASGSVYSDADDHQRIRFLKEVWKALKDGGNYMYNSLNSSL
jgi:hypothetical protein